MPVESTICTTNVTPFVLVSVVNEFHSTSEYFLISTVSVVGNIYRFASGLFESSFETRSCIASKYQVGAFEK